MEKVRVLCVYEDSLESFICNYYLVVSQNCKKFLVNHEDKASN